MAGYLGQKPAVKGLYTVDEFTSSGGTTYTLSRTPGDKNNIQVSAGGLVQYPSAYSVSGTTLTLSGVPSGQKVIVRHFGDTTLYPYLDDDSVTLAKMASGTDGNIITYDASGNPAAVATGTAGQVLTSAGAGAPPTFAAAAAGGKVLQVVSTVKQDTFTASTATYTTITGLSQAITPSATSSKILATYCVFGSPAGTMTTMTLGLFRGSTQVGGGTPVGSNRYSTSGNISSYSNHTYAAETVSFSFLDSPSTTSAITYSVKARRDVAGAFNINMVHVDDDTVYSARGSSTITLMEIGV